MDKQMTPKRIKEIAERAEMYVDKNWVLLWKRINLGGLVQHQSELAAVLTEFALAEVAALASGGGEREEAGRG